MNAGRFFCLCLSVLWIALSGQAWAQQVDLAEAQADMQDLRRRLNALQREIEASESVHKKETAALAATQREISSLIRQIRKLSEERQEAEEKLRALEAEQREVEQRIVSRQTELAEWLRQNYMHGADSVAFLLSEEDPNQLARDAHYMAHLGQARLALIDSLRADMQGKIRRAEEMEKQRNALAELEKKQRSRQDTLTAAQTKRKKALAALEKKLADQRAQAQALQQDEQHLSRVIDTLSKARQNAQQRLENSYRSSGPAVGGERPVPSNVKFASLKGKLRFPVPGVLAKRFGAPWQVGGATWKGVFIQAKQGTDVRAVASGVVVFSDWMRGYGNMLIIDHGDDYMSIYGNNDALFRDVGDRVKGGDAVSSVGASGIQSQSGLYFEIRHKGLPLDPQQWIK